MAMDGDDAGRDSNPRLHATAAALGRETIVVPLPDGQDPASWLAQEGPAGLTAFTRRLEEPTTPRLQSPPNAAVQGQGAAVVRLARTIEMRGPFVHCNSPIVVREDEDRDLASGTS